MFSLDDATIIPAGALFRTGDHWNVYGMWTAAPSSALSRRSGRLAAVAAGLQAGDTVIVYPSDSVAADGRVEAH